jgi:hypothetical protein
MNQFGTVDKGATIRNMLLEEYPDIIAKDGELGRVSICKHKIELVPDGKPFKQQVRRVPVHLRAEFEENLKSMLDRGIIRRSKSEFASPVVLVRKKNGQLRICIDYRRLNSITKKDSFPLPNMDDLIHDYLAKSTEFSLGDCAEGYLQVEIAVEDKHKTAFITEWGLFEFEVMPFGLTNAPATFQRMMEVAFEKGLRKFVLVFVDDVIVFSRNFDDHLKHVREMFETFRCCNLKLRIEKCAFAQPQVEFLGHVVGNGEVRPSPSKVKAIADFVRPDSVKKLRGFLGLAGWLRKFIRNFAAKAAPLYKAVAGLSSNAKVL